MSDRERMEVEAVAELAHLADDDPRLIEALRSPRTRALLALYGDFSTSAPAPAEARLAEAEAALSARLERELTLALPTARPQARLRAGGSWSRWFTPTLRPAWALAGLLAVAGLAWVMMANRGSDSGRVLRGGEATAFEAQVVTRSAEGVTFAWNAVPGADRYEVQLLGADLLTTLGHHESLRETRWTLAAADFPEGLKRGEGVAWQVVAYRGTEPIARTRMQTLSGR